MVKLKGLMSSRNMLLILAVVAVISFLSFYPGFTIAQNPYLTVRVADIVDNASIVYANVSLLDCTDESVLAYGLTAQNGSVSFNFTALGISNFTVKVSTTSLCTDDPSCSIYFIGLTDTNESDASGCFNVTDQYFMKEELYPDDIGSFNITVNDAVSGRPIEDSIVNIYEETTGIVSQADNYRCTGGVCSTGGDGSVMLFAGTAYVGKSREYFFSVTNDPDEYEDRNTTEVLYHWSVDPVFLPGTNRDETIEVNGSKTIRGMLVDHYNGQPVAGAGVSLVYCDDSYDTQIGFEGQYFYNVTTGSGGGYEIRAPLELLSEETLGTAGYAVNVTAEGYIDVIIMNHNQGENGFFGEVDMNTTNLTGEVAVSGRILDAINGEPIENALVFIENSTISYTIRTSANGSFILGIKNVSSYEVSVSASGYEDTWIGSYDGSDGNNNIGDVNMTGKALVSGRIIDVNRNSTNGYIPLVASITMTGSTYPYTVQSGSDGNFQIYVMSDISYEINASHPGYITNSSSFYANGSGGANDQGDISLTGRFKVNGTVRDNEDCIPNSDACRFPSPKLSGVSVYVFDLTNGNTYKVTTDSNGMYSLNIPSKNLTSQSVRYYSKYVKSGYLNTTLNNGGSNYVATSSPAYRTLNANLTGATSVSGNVRDFYSPPGTGSDMFIENATVEFFYYPGQTKAYDIETDPDGYFSIDMGFSLDSNYWIKVSKPGYEYNHYGDDLGGYSGGLDMTFVPSGTGYMQLTGLGRVYGNITDTFSGYPVFPSTVWIKHDDETKYRNDSINGSYEFRVDSTILDGFTVSGQSEGYTRKSFNMSTTGAEVSRNINLTAYFQTMITDAQNNWGIQNAYVQLYHFYNQTDFDAVTYPNISYLNETTLNVTVECGGNGTLDYINVTLVKASCPPGSSEYLAGLCYRSQNTTGGYTFFETMALGDYNVTVDGSDIGCGIAASGLQVTSNDTGTGMEESYTITETSLGVRVVDPIWFATGGTIGNLINSNVSIYNPGPYTGATPDNNGDGTYTFHFVPVGLSNVTANETYHFFNFSYYNITPGILNDFTSSPLILQPLPADLSIYVMDSTGNPADDGVIIILNNQTSPFPYVDENFYNSLYTMNSSSIGDTPNVLKTYRTIHDASTTEDAEFRHTENIPHVGTMNYFNVTVENLDGRDREFYVRVNGYTLSSGTLSDGEKHIFDHATAGAEFSIPGPQTINLSVVQVGIVNTTHRIYDASGAEDSGLTLYENIPKSGTIRSFNITVQNQEGYGINLNFSLSVNGKEIVSDESVADAQNMTFDATEYTSIFNLPGNQMIYFGVVNRNVTENVVLEDAAMQDDGFNYTENVPKSGDMESFNITIHNRNGTTIYFNLTVNDFQIADNKSILDDTNFTIDAVSAGSGFTIPGLQDINLTIMNESGTVLKANYTTYLNYSYERNVANYSIYTNYSYTSDKANYRAYVNYSYTTNYTTIVDGWANFTNVYPSVFWDAFVNGTPEGYNYTNMTGLLLEAGNLTVLSTSVRQNTLTVHVYALSGGSIVNIENANVTLYSDVHIYSSQALNGEGTPMTALTNGTGEVIFNRTIPGTYNITVNYTLGGFDTSNYTVTIGYGDNSFSRVLNDTETPYWTSRGTKVRVSGVWTYDIDPNQDDTTFYVFAYWMDNALLQQALLQINESGVVNNHSYMTLYDNHSWSNFSLSSSYLASHAGEDLEWRIIAKDRSDHWNTSMGWSSFHVNDTQLPTVSVEHIPQTVVEGKNVVFRATVTDNHNITDVDIFVDYENKSGGDIYTATGNWNCTITDGNMTVGVRGVICSYIGGPFNLNEIHYYYATASDSDGNTDRDPPEEDLVSTMSATLSSIRSHGGAFYVNTTYPEMMYFMGGEESDGSPSDTVEHFNVRTLVKSSSSNSLADERRAFGSAFDYVSRGDDGNDGYAWIIGGFNDSGCVGTVLTFNISSGTSSFSGYDNLPAARCNSPAAVFHADTNRIYLFGGDDGSGSATYSDAITYYDTTDGTHSTGNGRVLPYTSSKAVAVYSPVNDRIYIIGGVNDTSLVNGIAEYNPDDSSNAAVVQNLPVSMEGMSAAYHEDTEKIYIFGGMGLTGSVYYDTIFEFDPVTNEIRNMTATLPTERAFMYAAFSSYDNKIYVAGGEAATTHYDEIYQYDPVYGRSFTVTLTQANLTVTLQDNYGIVPECIGSTAGTYPSVRLWSDDLPNDQTYDSSDDGLDYIDGTGSVKFTELWPNTNYNIEVNGTYQGYNYTSTTVFVGTGEDSESYTLGTTQLTLNVTNETGEPAEGATYHVYIAPQNTTHLTTCSNNEITGTVDSTGLVTYDKVLPCGSGGCNLTVEKEGWIPSWNSTAFELSPGDNITVHIDPPGRPEEASLGPASNYYVNTVGDENTLNISVWGRNWTDNLVALQYVNVSFIRDDGDIEFSNLTDSEGMTTIIAEDGVYNISIDGTGTGYSSTLVENVKIGKLVFAEGTTDTSGQFYAIVDGQPMYTPLAPRQVPDLGYYARIRTAGYGNYDTLNESDDIFRGTYYDNYSYEYQDKDFEVEESFKKYFYGLARISGHIGDEYCGSTQCENVTGAYVNVVMPGGSPDTLTRYNMVTASDGLYDMNVSPYKEGSPWNAGSLYIQDYNVEVVKTEGEGQELKQCYKYYNTKYEDEQYADGMQFSIGEEKTVDMDLEGAGYVWGHVYGLLEETVGISATVQTRIGGSLYYSGKTNNETGLFNITINPCTNPYLLFTDPANWETYWSGFYSGTVDNVTISLYGIGQGGFRVYVMNETGDHLNNVNVSLRGKESHDLVTYENGTASISSLKSYGDASYYEYNLTVDGSHLGYYINSSMITIPLGSEGIFYVDLNATGINVSLYGSVLNDTTVHLTNESGAVRNGTLVNGSVLFSVIPTGEYNLSFSDVYESNVYYLNGQPLKDNVTTVNITEAEAGQVTGILHDLDETRAFVNVTNYLGEPVDNLTVYLYNSIAWRGGAITYNTTTGTDGLALFRQILPAYDYVVSFDNDELQDLGLIIKQNSSIEVTGGENETLGNNLTFEVQDIQVRFTLETGHGVKVENANISLLDENGSVFNSSGNVLNGTTDSDGNLTIHSVPTGTYPYRIDANASGYGIWNNSEMTVQVDPDSLSYVHAEMSPLTLMVYVDDDGGTVKENVNISIRYLDEDVVNATDATQTCNATPSENNRTFTHFFLYPTDYTANVTSPRYFSQEENFTFNDLTVPGITVKAVYFSLTERKITVNLENSSGQELVEGVNVTIQNSSGNVLLSTNGTFYLNNMDVNDSTIFTHIPDTASSINVTSSLYFNSSQPFSTDNITDGITTFNFTMTERTIYVELQDPQGNDLTHNVTVWLNYTAGGAVTDTEGSPIAPIVNTTNALESFEKVPDGNFYVNVTSDYYFSQSDSIDTTQIAAGGNNTLTYSMYERTVTVSVYDFADRGLTSDNITVMLYNSTSDQAKNTTGEDLTGSTITGVMKFTGILDDVYNISANSTNSSTYTPQNETFDPSEGTDTDVDIYLKKLDYGYFNVTVYQADGTTPISGATVYLYNTSTSGALIDLAVTGSIGNAIVEVNVSEYNQSDKNMTIYVTASGYVANSTYSNVSDQGVVGISLTLAAEPYVPPTPGGSHRTTGGTIGAVTSETQSLGDVYADTSKTAQFTLSGTLNVQTITVLTDEDASGASVTVKASSKPSGSPNVISALDGIVYKYLDISAVNLPDSILTSATITFKVPKSWVTTNGINPDDVYMYRYSGGVWNKLSTVLLSDDGTWYYYRCTSPGFSTFAIAGYYISEKDMEPTLYATYLNANDCKTVYLTVKNTGGMTLTNVHVDKLDADWGTITQSRGISSLGSGVQDRVTLRICADRDAEKDIYDYSIDAVSDQLTKTVSSQVQVTKTYLEVLTEQIEALEAELDALDAEQLGAEGRGYYDSAKVKISDSMEYLDTENYDDAINSLGEASDYFDRIKDMEPEKGYMDMFVEWVILNYILASVIAAIFIAMSSVVLFRRRISSEMPELPTGGEVLGGVMRVGEETINSLMSMARELETRVDRIDFENLGENERKWYGKVRLQIENIKRSIDGGEFKKAQRHVNDAELYMKMLELNTSTS